MALEINLKNKTVLITGVTSGIGAGIAKMFARAGADIAGCGRHSRDSDVAKRFTESVEECRAKALYVQTNVTKAEQLQQLVDETISRFGKIDILVSNAGINFFEGAADCTEEEWMKNHDLNLAAHWRLAKLCKPYLQKQQGVIIIMTSNHAFATIPGCFPYNVTKTALTGLVRSLAIEWGPEIRTVGLAPGFIDTPGNQTWFNSFADAAGERQRTIALHPVKKIGTTEEVGAWCVFLASEYASFASGTTYLLDGGRSALLQD
ncbi:SDR family oxidoreductase (plasmid) [Pedobacter sp. BS3]|uniref:SDR family NAD(P)-dependent oxidoreductase n=1 Tax=Pedobacter sp. BS3 TaxID=2567937 RepID=UPI0011EBAC8D|nr:SDR family oxidoreductase [Pedobacter sp. BS3]TZF85844.1 SDR family oxidoreductase [Pedobacter sp. BS3]